jgi:hypothetical protein
VEFLETVADLSYLTDQTTWTGLLVASLQDGKREWKSERLVAWNIAAHCQEHGSSPSSSETAAGGHLGVGGRSARYLMEPQVPKALDGLEEKDVSHG